MEATISLQSDVCTMSVLRGRREGRFSLAGGGMIEREPVRGRQALGQVGAVVHEEGALGKWHWGPRGWGVERSRVRDWGARDWGTERPSMRDWGAHGWGVERPGVQDWGPCGWGVERPSVVLRGSSGEGSRVEDRVPCLECGIVLPFSN